MKNLIITVVAILMAQPIFAQVVKVDDLIFKKQTNNTVSTRGLVIDPVTGIVGWKTISTPPTIPPVSSSVSGIVNNTSLQELGGVDKTINEVRIGKGGGNRSNNVAIGMDVLRVNEFGNYNTGVGGWALELNTTGGFNTGLGNGALGSNTMGGQNTAVGQSAMGSNTEGHHNTAVGISAIGNNITGTYNAVLGDGAGLYVGSTGTTANTGVDNGTYIGSKVRASALGVTNETVIGSQAVGSGSNTVTLGNPNVTDVYTYGKVNAPSYKVSALNTAPSSATDTGTVGEIRYTATYIYICTATNIWVRAALATW